MMAVPAAMSMIVDTGVIVIIVIIVIVVIITVIIRLDHFVCFLV